MRDFINPAATSQGLEELARAIQIEHGENAVNLRIAEHYIEEFGKLAKKNNQIILPTDLSNIRQFIETNNSTISK